MRTAINKRSNQLIGGRKIVKLCLAVFVVLSMLVLAGAGGLFFGNKELSTTLSQSIMNPGLITEDSLIQEMIDNGEIQLESAEAVNWNWYHTQSGATGTTDNQSFTAGKKETKEGMQYITFSGNALTSFRQGKFKVEASFDLKDNNRQQKQECNIFNQAGTRLGGTYTTSKREDKRKYSGWVTLYPATTHTQIKANFIARGGSSWIRNDGKIADCHVQIAWNAPAQLTIKANTNGTVKLESGSYASTQYKKLNGFSESVKMTGKGNSGYYCSGWSNSGGYGNPTTSSSAMTVYGYNAMGTYTANFAPQVYNIKFNPGSYNGFTPSNNSATTVYSYTYNSSAKKLLNSSYFSMPGYTFKGWKNPDGTLLSESLYPTTHFAKWLPGQEGKATTTIELTAVWEPIKYKVKFVTDAEGGQAFYPRSTTLSSNSLSFDSNGYVTLTYDVPFTLANEMGDVNNLLFWKTGYYFYGFKLQSGTLVSSARYNNNVVMSATTLLETDSDTIKNLTHTSGASLVFVAQWVPIKYVFGFYDNKTGTGGTRLTTVVGTYDSAIPSCGLDINESPRYGYTLGGWETSVDGAYKNFGNAVTGTVNKAAFGAGAYIAYPSNVPAGISPTHATELKIFKKWTQNDYRINYANFESATTSTQTIKYNDGKGSVGSVPTAVNGGVKYYLLPISTSGFDYAYHTAVGYTSSDGAVDSSTLFPYDNTKGQFYFTNSHLLSELGLDVLTANNGGVASNEVQVYWNLDTDEVKSVGSGFIEIQLKGAGQTEPIVDWQITDIEGSLDNLQEFYYRQYENFILNIRKVESEHHVKVEFSVADSGLTNIGQNSWKTASNQIVSDTKYKYIITGKISSNISHSDLSEEFSVEKEKIFEYKITKATIKVDFVISENTDIAFDNSNKVGYFDVRLTGPAVERYTESDYEVKYYKDGASCSALAMSTTGEYNAKFINKNIYYSLVSGSDEQSSPTLTISKRELNITNTNSSMVYDGEVHNDKKEPIIEIVKPAGEGDFDDTDLISYITSKVFVNADREIKDAKVYNIIYTLSDTENLIFGGAVSSFSFNFTIEKCKIEVSIEGNSTEYDKRDKIEFMSPIVKNALTDEVIVAQDGTENMVIDYTFTISNLNDIVLYTKGDVNKTIINADSYYMTFENLDSNFDLQYDDIEENINKFDINISKKNVRMYFSEVINANHTFKYVYSGSDNSSFFTSYQYIEDYEVFEGDSLSVTKNGNVDLGEFVGVGEATIRYANSNYNLYLYKHDGSAQYSSADGFYVKQGSAILLTFTINKREATLSNLVYSQVFNEQSQAFNYDFNNIVAGESFTATNNAWSDVGVYNIIITATKNYKLKAGLFEEEKFSSGGIEYNVVLIETEGEGYDAVDTMILTVEISKKKLVITPNSRNFNFVYGKTIEEISDSIDYKIYTGGSLVDNSIATIKFSIADCQYNVTPYALKFDFNNSTIDNINYATNYELVFDTANNYSVTISRKGLDINIDDFTKAYGEDYTLFYKYMVKYTDESGSIVDNTLSVDDVSLCMEDTLTIVAREMTRTDLSYTAVGDHKINIFAEDITIVDDSGNNRRANYSINYNNGTSENSNAILTIEKADMEVRFVSTAPISVPYGASEQAFEFKIYLNGQESIGNSLFYGDTAIINGKQIFRNPDASKNVATYIIDNINLLNTTEFSSIIENNGNYNLHYSILSPTGIRYIITQASLKVVFDEISVTYGEEEKNYMQNIESSISGVTLKNGQGSFNNDKTLYVMQGTLNNGAKLFLDIRRVDTNGIFSGNVKNVGVYRLEIYNLSIKDGDNSAEYLIYEGGTPQNLTNYCLEALTYGTYTIQMREIYILPDANQKMGYGSYADVGEYLTYDFTIEGGATSLGAGESFAGALEREGQGDENLKGNYSAGNYKIIIGSLSVLTNGVNEGNYNLIIREQDEQIFEIEKATITISIEEKEVEYGLADLKLSYGYNIFVGQNVTNVATNANKLIKNDDKFVGTKGNDVTKADSLSVSLYRENSKNVGRYNILVKNIYLNGEALSVVNNGQEVTDYTTISLTDYRALDNIQSANYIINFDQANERYYTIKPFEISESTFNANKDSLFVFDASKVYDGTNTVTVTNKDTAKIIVEVNNSFVSVDCAVQGATGYYTNTAGTNPQINATKDGDKYYIVVFFLLENASFEADLPKNGSMYKLVYSASDAGFSDMAITTKDVNLDYQYNNDGVWTSFSDGQEIFTYNANNHFSDLRITTSDFVASDNLDENNTFIGSLENNMVKYAQTYSYSISDIGYSTEVTAKLKNYNIVSGDETITFAVKKASLEIMPVENQKSQYGIMIDQIGTLRYTRPTMCGSDNITVTLALDTDQTGILSTGEYSYKIADYSIAYGEIAPESYEVSVNADIKYLVEEISLVYLVNNVAEDTLTYYGQDIDIDLSISDVVLTSGQLFSGHTIVVDFVKEEGLDAGLYDLTADFRVMDTSYNDLTSNYNIKMVFATTNSEVGIYSIEKLPITITPLTASSKYHQEYSEINYNITSIYYNFETDGELANGDSYSLVLAPLGADSETMLDVKNYPIIKESLVVDGVDISAYTDTQLLNDIDNYIITYINNRYYAVTESEIEVVLADVNVTYGDINISGSDFSDLVVEKIILDGVDILGSDNTFSLYEDDSIDISPILTRSLGKNVGTYNIVLKKVGGTYVKPTFLAGLAGNYKLKSPNYSLATYTIEQLDVSVGQSLFITDFTKVYDGTTTASGIVMEELEGAYEESITFENILGEYNTSEVESANTINGFSLVYGAELDNYNIILEQGIAINGTITPKEINIAHSSSFVENTYTHTYNGSNILNVNTLVIPSIVENNLVASDESYVDTKYVVTNGYGEGQEIEQFITDGGTYTIKPILIGEKESNYAIIDASEKTVRVNAREISLTAEKIVIDYGQKINDFIYEKVDIGGQIHYVVKAYKVSGMVTGDDIKDYFDISMETATAGTGDTIQNVGVYDLNFGSVPKANSRPNYAIVNSGGQAQYEVIKKEIVIYIGVASKTFGESDSSINWADSLTLSIVTSEAERIKQYISDNGLIYRNNTSESVANGPYALYGRELPEALTGDDVFMNNYQVTYDTTTESALLYINKKDLKIALNKTNVDIKYGASLDYQDVFYTSGVLNANPSDLVARDMFVSGLSLPDVSKQLANNGSPYDVGTIKDLSIGNGSSDNYNLIFTDLSYNNIVNKVTATIVANELNVSLSSKTFAYEIEDINSDFRILANKLYEVEGLAQNHEVVLTKDYSLVEEKDNRIIILYSDNLDAFSNLKGQREEEYTITPIEMKLSSGIYANYTLNTEVVSKTSFVWIVNAKPVSQLEGLYLGTYNGQVYDVTNDTKAPKFYAPSDLDKTTPLNNMIDSIEYYTSYTPGDEMNDAVFAGSVTPVNAGTYYCKITTIANEEYDSITLVAVVRILKGQAVFATTQEVVNYGDDTITISISATGVEGDSYSFTDSFDYNIAEFVAGNHTAVYRYRGSDNYEEQEVECNFTIGKKELNADFSNNDDVDFVYDGKAKTITYDWANLLPSDDLTKSIVYLDSNGEIILGNPILAGDYVARVVAESDNYEITDASVSEYSFTISPAVLFVNALNINVQRNENFEVLKTYNGFVNGETMSVVVEAPEAVYVATDKALDSSESGNFVATLKGGVANNYVFEYGEFSFIVRETELVSGNKNIILGGDFNDNAEFSIESKYYVNGAVFEDDKEKSRVESYAKKLNEKEGKDYVGMSKFDINITNLDSILSDKITLSFNLYSTNKGDVAQKIVNTIMTSSVPKTVLEQAVQKENSIKRGGFNDERMSILLVKVTTDEKGEYKYEEVKDVEIIGDYMILELPKEDINGEYLVFSYTESPQSYAFIIIVAGIVLALVLGLFIFIAIKRR